MKPTKALHDLGQSLWLDNITRELLNSGTLQRYIDELSVTGLTSNPTIFDHAIKNSGTYDADISRRAPSAKSAEDLFFDLALADLTRAAELFQPVFARTDGVDGWVSLEVSPLLAHDTNSTLAAARNLHQRGGKPNLFIKIPGTAEGLPAIEAAIFAGVPVNVTLLFSREQYVAAAEAYLRGVERRIEAGLNPAVASVASLFVSRWDVAVSGKVPGELTNRLGIAVAQRAYKAYRELLASARFQRAANAGARAQRLLFASTGTKDPKASDILYVKALAAPFTVNTMPEGTLNAVRRPRRSRRDPRTGRRRLRDGSGQLRQGGHRHRCAGRQAPGRGCLVLRQVLERPDRLHRFQERRDPQGELMQMTVASRQRKRAPESAREQSMSVPALRERPAWAALEKHHQKMAGLHLRQLFAEDRTRGERLAVEAAGIYLDYSKNRITDETLATPASACPGSGIAGSHRRHVPGRQDQRLGEPRGASRRPARAAGRFHHCTTARTWCPRFMPFWTRWQISLVGYAAAPGRAIRASASAM